ncbi:MULTISPECIES: acyl-CoA dehydrogenase family protein [unclassified Micromonospora]|uniref:acyl-CoA dehydrogenase family protein n=1 Tax=unclassified Micromonospora TaxID=2617518 RepID=UPI0033B9827A
MSDERELLAGAVTDLLTDHCGPDRVAAADGGWDEGLWRHLDRAGLTGIGIPEEAGGSGGDVADAAVVARLCASFAAPVPIAPTLLVAPWLRDAAGLAQRPGPAAVAGKADVTAVRADGGWTLHGEARGVPWGGCAASVLVLASTDEGLALAEVVGAAATPGTSPAGEPSDTLRFHGLGLPDERVRPVTTELLGELRLRQALATTVMLAGALDRVLQLTRRYVGERVQFGKPISSFQLVKQKVAVLAGEVAVAGAAADAAVLAVAAGSTDAAPAVLAARVRAARSATAATAIAHQLHGALGFTREHQLQHFTRRLWAWRDDGDAEGTLQEELGRILAERGAAGFWPTVVRAGV